MEITVILFSIQIQIINFDQRKMEVKKTLKRGYIKFYEYWNQKEVNPPPLIFFLMFFYFHFFRHTHARATVYLLSVFPLTTFAILNVNFMYMVSQFIRLPNLIPAVIIFFITLAVSCNDKEKTFIFLFTIGDALIKDANFHAIYLLFAAGILSYQIYTYLTCKNLSYNRQYFTGFFVISVYGGIEFIDLNISTNLNIVLQIFLLFIAGLYAYHLFGSRLKKLSKMNVEHIKDSRVLAFYLAELQQSVKFQFVKESKLSIHRRKCSRASCFCHKEDLRNEKYFLRQLFENSIRKFEQSCDTLLFQHYIHFLVKNQMMMNALHFLAKWNPHSHYSFIAKLKCTYMIKTILADIESSNLYEKQYQYVLQYDDLLLKLTVDIYEVLELKLRFWHQVAKETPVMMKLQDNGLKIVDQMYALNSFYNKVIKKYEKKLYSFDATILYAMYLLSTTNYQEYAELIIKNTSKVLEETQILESNSSETCAISMVVKQEGLYHMKDAPVELDSLQDQKLVKKTQANQNRSFKFIINNSSNSFCKIMKTNKEELIGEELGFLIPNGYKESHKRRILRLLNFQDQELGYIVSSKRMHRNSKVPIKVGENQLVMTYVSIKTMLDIEEGSVFVSIIKMINDKKIDAMISFEGKLLEREQGFNEEILMHSEFKKYFSIIVDRWNRERVVKEERFNVMMNSMNFCIVIYSPVSTNVSSQQLFNGFPPLHIEIINESSTKNKGVPANGNEKLVKQIKHMDNALNHDTESTSSTKNSSNSAVSILSTFSEKNSAPVYRKIIIGFIIVITCSLVVSMVGFLVFNLEWDTTNVNSNNPLNDTMNYMKLNHVTLNLLSVLWDVRQYKANSNLNKTQITNYANSAAPYDTSALTSFNSRFNTFKSIFYKILRSPSSTLQNEISNRLKTVIALKSNMSAWPTNVTIIPQNITLQSLLMNYMIDCNLVSRGIYDDRILFASTLSSQVIILQGGLTFTPIIDSSIDSSLSTSQILAICMNVVIVLLIVPMFFFLRSRLPLHQKIFDLFASIQSDMVVSEIKSLTYVNNIIKNYEESSDVLKANVLDYEKNAIYPKERTQRNVSASNEMIAGLEKYDTAGSNSSSDFEETNQKETIGLNSIYAKNKKKSHINFEEMKAYSQMKKTVQKRKRDGELDFTGSQSDPHACINKKHLIFYLMTIFFAIFLSLQLITIQSFGQQFKIRKNNLISLFQNYIGNQISFSLGKIYLRDGLVGLSKMSPIYNLAFLQSRIQSIPTYDYTNYYGYDTIYANCTIKNSNGTYVPTRIICMYNYSYLTVLAEFGAVLKQLFEARYTADQSYNTYVANNQTEIYNQILTNISSKVFYLQSIDNILERMVYDIAENVYSDILQYSQSINSLKLGIFIFSVCWWLLTALLGVVMLLKMKRQYFKQVYMLTFLNSQMLTNNKRVESFLDSINKSSSN